MFAYYPSCICNLIVDDTNRLLQASPMIAVTFILTILAGVNAWGEEGHKIVAAIAAEVLTSNANSLVSDFCGDYSLPDIAPLPDDYDHTSEVNLIL